jgi:predicted RNA-binding protein with PUA-like domain
MAYWLFKSEPDVFSWDALKAKGAAGEEWTGIRNYQARNMIRDDMKVGDRALFYHSSCKEVGVAGEMRIIGNAEPDPTQFDQTSNYYDPKSMRENPRWLGIKVRHVATWDKVVQLSAIRTEPQLLNLTILKTGNRLSITQISKDEYELIKSMI